MSGYKRVNFYELCRLCATNREKKKIHIFKDEGVRIHLQVKIQAILSVKVREDDLLPKVVCIDCINNLEDCFIFRNECLNSAGMLSKYFDNFKHTEDFKKSGQVYIKDCPKKDKAKPASAQIKTERRTEDDERDLAKFAVVLNPVVLNTTNFPMPLPNNENQNLNWSGYGYNFPNNTSEMTNVVAPNSTDDRETKPDVAVKDERAPRTFPCELCSKVFKRREHLYQHVKLHTGFRPFVCEHCKKAFIRKEHLHRHAMSHSGLRNFTCDVCNKSFSRNDNLLKHKKIHDKANLYTCETCNKKFDMKHYYLVHKATHESNKNDFWS